MRLIDVKTLEKIKKSIRECLGFHPDCYDGCDECTYYNEAPFCKGALCRDVIACINHMEDSINLNALRDAIYQDAVAHGLWESTDYTVQLCINDYMECKEPFDKDELMREWAMQVIRREVDELEAASEDAEAYAEELGDVIIAALSVAGKLGIDIDAAVKRKMEVNKRRPWRHGKGV